jgi:Tol biopolymer transport system component
MKMKRLAAVAGPLFLCSFAAAQSKHTPTIPESLSLKFVSSPKISPDCRFVAYSVEQADWKGNEYVTQLWLVNVRSGQAIQLTRGKKSAGGADWSPDGHWLAFLTERESSAIEPFSEVEKEAEKEKKDEKKEDKKEPEPGKPAASQIWIISPEGGEAWQLTKAETEISEFHWSKDSRSIAFSANAPESRASKDRKEKYSDYEVYEKDYRQNQLWSVDVTEAEKAYIPVAAKRLLSDLTLNVTDFSWSPDSTEIAFAATANPFLAFRGDQDIYLLNLSKNNAVKKIVALPGPDSNPIFSPDGKELAFGTSLAEPYYYYANGHIAVVQLSVVLNKPATTPADVEDLTAKFDEDPYILDWGPDGIYFAGLQKTNVHLFRVDPRSTEVSRVSSPDTLVLEDASLTSDFNAVAFVAPSSTLMEELYVSPISSFAPKKLTDMTAQVKGWSLSGSHLLEEPGRRSDRGHLA